jgi:hypothetical protein
LVISVWREPAEITSTSPLCLAAAAVTLDAGTRWADAADAAIAATSAKAASNRPGSALDLKKARKLLLLMADLLR